MARCLWMSVLHSSTYYARSARLITQRPRALQSCSFVSGLQGWYCCSGDSTYCTLLLQDDKWPSWAALIAMKPLLSRLRRGRDDACRPSLSANWAMAKRDLSSVDLSQHVHSHSWGEKQARNRNASLYGFDGHANKTRPIARHCTQQPHAHIWHRRRTAASSASPRPSLRQNVSSTNTSCTAAHHTQQQQQSSSSTMQHPRPPQPPGLDRIAILKFADLNRYGTDGVPASILYGGGTRYIVSCKRQTKLNQWAKVRLRENASDAAPHYADLIELLGPVGDHPTELLAFQLHFRVKPCKYPTDWTLNKAEERRDCRDLHCASIDNASTRDVDDALSLHEENGRTILGVHIADVACRIPAGSPLDVWALERAASAYNSGVDTGEEYTSGSSSVPMLPPQLAHDELSLNQDVDRNAVTLWLDIENGQVLSKRHERTLIRNKDKTTYQAMGDATSGPLYNLRKLLTMLSGEEDPEDLIAWAMIRYNAHMGAVLASQQRWPGGVLRAQKEPKTAASYVPGNGTDVGHASLELDFYAHASSPIRRYADLINQRALFHEALPPKWGDDSLVKLNDRNSELARYHASVDAMELAYSCRNAPRIYDGRIETDEDGLCLLVHTEKRRARVPLHDSYFAEPIMDAVSEGEVKVELFGVLISSRTRLRARLLGVGESVVRGFSEGDTAQEVFKHVPATTKKTEPLTEQASAYLQAAALALEDAQDDKPVTEALEETYVNETLGYPIDDFQQRSLKVITNPDLDLLAMAPTGSGKTAVALIAILQAFKRGLRAVYTSPIKALSNQKYAEFCEWFKKKGIEAHVTLLTGDVKIRAPPGCEKELIICTSEILRNKLVKASGQDVQPAAVHFAAAKAAADAGDTEAAIALEALVRDGFTGAGDPDLERLGCVVSDEIHYINDVDRGAVWEETLMHLPSSIQLVALSATLKDPMKFVAWIQRTRGRKGELVRRLDRHVPLHVGGLDPQSGAFLEMFGTHDSGEHKGGEFDAAQFTQLFSLKALENSNEKSAKAKSAAAGAKAERGAEHQARRDAFAGGQTSKGGRASSGRGLKTFGRGGRGGAKPQPKKLNFEAECTKLAKALDAADKCPAIVFCMSRAKCAQGAHACKGLNLLLGTRGPPEPDRDLDPSGHYDWEQNEALRHERVRTAESQRQAMHRKYLQRYMPELGELEAYRDINFLLERGVAYHHSGMLPILREFVELCFQQKLVRLVFATETLAVGVNMPARTVVFTQLDKPDDTGAKQGHRWLRVDEFWQMAGRAGRRGMDSVGYVVYAPTLSVAGLRNLCPVHEMNRMLTADVIAATSQLVVDRPFVLRHVARGHGVEVLEKTLKADEARRLNGVLEERMQKASLEETSLSETDQQVFARYRIVVQKLEPAQSQAATGIAVRVSQKDVKKLQKERRALEDAWPGGSSAFLEALNKEQSRDRERSAITQNNAALRDAWVRSQTWLEGCEFIDPSGGLTPRGKCAAAFADGQPLIIGTCIADGALRGLSQSEVMAWICLFIPDRSGKEEDGLPKDIAQPSPDLQATCAYADELAGQLDLDPMERRLMMLALDWIRTKDIHRVARCVDPALLGSFVKSVMRVLSYVDVVREVLLGLGEYATHNVLDAHADALLGGLVTNESLYLRLD